MASKKVKCEICGYTGHILMSHVKKVHSVSPEEYEKTYPGSPLMSEAGRLRVQKRKEARKTQDDNRETVMVSIRDTFGIDLGYEIEEDAAGNPVYNYGGEPKYKLDKTGNKIPNDNLITAFKHPGTFTPDIDPSYVFDKQAVMHFIIGVECNDRVLLTGPTGSGKSTHPEQIAARLNYNFVRIDFSLGILREHLVGTMQYSPDKGTYFEPGILPKAMQLPGTIIQLDEWDSIGPSCSMVIQRLLEKSDGRLLINENAGQLIELHKQSVVCATANTIGLGDDSGLYSQGTTIQNYAQLNRFGITIQLDYVEPEVEKGILRRTFREDANGEDCEYPDGNQVLEENEIDSFVKTLNTVREGFVNGEISVPLSTRDLINWVEKFLMTSDVREAALMCFLNRMPEVDRLAVDGIIQRTFELA